jgi:hypothetical protein
MIVLEKKVILSYYETSEAHILFRAKDSEERKNNICVKQTIKDTVSRIKINVNLLYTGNTKLLQPNFKYKIEREKHFLKT